jgi:hypothetical protein
MLKSSTPSLQVQLCNQVFGAENRILRGLEIGGVEEGSLKGDPREKSRQTRLGVCTAGGR